MSKLRDILESKAKPLEPSVDWIELVRYLDDPVSTPAPETDFSARWAGKKDLMAISAMQYFVKEVELMEKDLERGDQCLLLERFEQICAFSWVTFRDCRMGLWHILRLPFGFAYQVYIHVQPEYRRKGVGTYLLNLLSKELREMGYHKLISGTFGHWEIPMRFHMKAGFKICRKYSERRLFGFFSYPPKVTEFRA
jgi:GNAT superfamily N-acetyltransferase